MSDASASQAFKNRLRSNLQKKPHQEVLFDLFRYGSIGLYLLVNKFEEKNIKLSKDELKYLEAIIKDMDDYSDAVYDIVINDYLKNRDIKQAVDELMVLQDACGKDEIEQIALSRRQVEQAISLPPSWTHHPVEPQKSQNTVSAVEKAAIPDLHEKVKFSDLNGKKLKADKIERTIVTADGKSYNIYSDGFLGKGGFGEVKLAQNTEDPNQWIAVKIMVNPHGAKPEIIQKEADNLSNSKELVFSESLEGKYFDVNFIGMNLQKGVDLCKAMGLSNEEEDKKRVPLVEAQILLIAKNLLKAAVGVLENKVAIVEREKLRNEEAGINRIQRALHRDYKLENFMIDTNLGVKVIDYGMVTAAPAANLSYELVALMSEEESFIKGRFYVKLTDEKNALIYRVVNPQGELTEEKTISLSHLPLLKAAFKEIDTNDHSLVMELIQESLPDILALTSRRGDTASEIIEDQKIGTVAYMAPELLNSRKAEADFTEKSDVWAIGVVLIELMGWEHQIPYGNYYRTILRADIAKLADADELVALVKRMHDPDPNNRPNLKVVYATIDKIIKNTANEDDTPRDLKPYAISMADFEKALKAGKADEFLANLRSKGINSIVFYHTAKVPANLLVEAKRECQKAGFLHILPDIYYGRPVKMIIDKIENDYSTLFGRTRAKIAYNMATEFTCAPEVQHKDIENIIRAVILMTRSNPDWKFNYSVIELARVINKNEAIGALMDAVIDKLELDKATLKSGEITVDRTFWDNGGKQLIEDMMKIKGIGRVLAPDRLTRLKSAVSVIDPENARNLFKSYDKNVKDDARAEGKIDSSGLKVRQLRSRG